MNKKLTLYPIAAILIVGVVIAAWMNSTTHPAVADPTPAPAPAPASVESAAITDSGINLRRTVTVQVVQKTKDAVVNISTRKLVDQRVTFSGPFMQPFDTGQVVRVPANSLGSGFIINKDGYVVTNNHVIDRAREISVELADGRKLSADLISADPDADLAVLRIHSDKPFPTMDLGESGDLMIGEPVIAVGNPLGFSHSVSTGIVSALHRDIEPRQPENADAEPVHGEEAALRDLIQTDAAINPGNSGGPLLNAYGQVIAINTAIRGDAQNIGFAIPIDRLRDLIPELMNPSVATKVDVPLKLIEQRTMIEPATIKVALKTPGKNGETLQFINGQHPANIVDAYAMLLNFKANQAFDVTWSNDKTQRFVCKATPIPDAISQARQRFGMTIEQVTPMLADRKHLNQEDGLLIDAVDPDGAAAKCGLNKGDIIVQMGPVPTTSLDDLGALIPRLPDEGTIGVIFIRGNRIGQFRMKL
jgi:serine protease Do